MSSKIILRRDTGANWGSVNPVLADGELGFETDTRRFKLGNGTSTWNALSYALNTLMYGTINPVSGIGLNGDFYINTVAVTIFGPKAAGTWPAGTNIKGLGITPQAVGFTLSGGTTAKTLTVDVDCVMSNFITKTSLGGGGTETTAGVDIALTASSTKLQVVTSLNPMVSLVLPNVTTLGSGGDLFILKALGDYGFDVKSYDGNLICSVPENGSMSLWLIGSNWYAGDTSVTPPDILNISGTEVVLNATQTANPLIEKLSDTVYIAMYQNQVYRVITLSGTSMTLGAEFGLDGAWVAQYVAMSAINATQCLIVFTSDTANIPKHKACVLTVTGTTITVGAILSTTIYRVYNTLKKISDTQFLNVFASDTLYLTAQVLTVSGTTVTAGAAYTLTNAVIDKLSLARLDASRFVATYYKSPTCESSLITVAGTVVTMTAIRVYHPSARFTDTASISVSGNKIMVIGRVSANSYLEAQILDFYTLDTGPIVTLPATNDVRYSPVMVSDTQCRLLYIAPAGGLMSVKLTINGNVITPNQSYVVSSATTVSPRAAAVKAGRVLVVYTGSPTTARAILIG